MNIKPIRNDAGLQEDFERLEVIFQSEKGAPLFDEMEVLVTLIEFMRINIIPSALLIERALSLRKIKIPYES